MNLRERAWRRDVARAVEALDARIASDEMNNEDRIQLIVLRERLAGVLGAEDGWTSTPELRERAQRDYAEAAKVLGLSQDELRVPGSGAPKGVLSRTFDDYRPAAPRRGDRR